MSRPSVTFPRAYQRHLVSEQRKAVLAALRDRIGPEHTVGEVLDAADALGWAEPMGDLSLADLAAALLAPIGAATQAEADDEDELEDELEDEVEDEDEVEVEVQAPARRERAGKATKKKTASKAPPAKPTKVAARGKKTASRKAPAREPEPRSKKGAGKKGAGKKASKTAPATTARGKKAATPVISKKTGKSRRAAPVDFDEPMSLEEAAGVLVPLVKGLGEATMQDLEEQTAGGRRKLRFHIGQLVRHGHLRRHGMGRGTFYTVG